MTATVVQRRSDVAALIWRAHDGSRWLATSYPAADGRWAEEHVQGERIA